MVSRWHEWMDQVGRLRNATRRISNVVVKECRPGRASQASVRMGFCPDARPVIAAKCQTRQWGTPLDVCHGRS